MWSLASDSHETCMQNSLRGRVGPEDLEELTAFLDFGQHVPDGLGVAMSLEVDEVHVLPWAPLGRSRLDLGQVQPPLRERRQDAVEHARLVLHREEDRGLVVSSGRVRPRAEYLDRGG